MAKILFGLAVGAVAAALAVLVVSPATDPVDAMDLLSSESAQRAQAMEYDSLGADSQSGRDSNSITAPDSTVASERSPLSSDVDSISSGFSVNAEEAEARLEAELELAQQAASLAGDALADFRIEQMLAASEVITPFRLPPEFGWVSERRYPNMFHEQFQREPVDTAWAAPTRDDMRAPVDARALMDHFLSRMPGAFNCEDYFCDTNANQQDGTTTIFWGMHRKREQLQSLVAGATE